MATSQQIDIMYGNLIMRGLVVKNIQDSEMRAAVMRNVSDELSCQIYECALPNIQNHIIRNSIFLPTAPAEIIKIHDMIVGFYAPEVHIAKTIAERSLELFYRMDKI